MYVRVKEIPPDSGNYYKYLVKNKGGETYQMYLGTAASKNDNKIPSNVDRLLLQDGLGIEVGYGAYEDFINEYGDPGRKTRGKYMNMSDAKLVNEHERIQNARISMDWVMDEFEKDNYGAVQTELVMLAEELDVAEGSDAYKYVKEADEKLEEGDYKAAEYKLQNAQEIIHEKDEEIIRELKRRERGGDKEKLKRDSESSGTDSNPKQVNATSPEQDDVDEDMSFERLKKKMNRYNARYPKTHPHLSWRKYKDGRIKITEKSPRGSESTIGHVPSSKEFDSVEEANEWLEEKVEKDPNVSKRDINPDKPIVI